MRRFLPFLFLIAFFSTSNRGKIVGFHSYSPSLNVHLWCCFLPNRKVKYFNMKGSFSDSHTVCGIAKGGKEVSCSTILLRCPSHGAAVGTLSQHRGVKGWSLLPGQGPTFTHVRRSSVFPPHLSDLGCSCCLQ